MNLERSPDSRKSNLSPARRRLVELFQEVHYGEIHDLRIVAGEPVLDPPPEIYRDLVLGRDNGPHSARGRADFALKSEIVALLQLLDDEQYLSISRIIVQAGLPLRIRVRVGASK